MNRKIFIITVFIVCFLVLNGLGVAAETYPNKAIQFIVPWSPGGGSDTLMRITAKYLEKYLDSPVPVINKPGVSGTIGLQEFSTKPSNGYYIAQIHEGLLSAYHTDITDLNYDSFLPVVALTDSPQYLAVKADAPYDTFEEFIDYAQENPGEIKFAVTIKGIAHIWGAILENYADIQFKYVSYEGTGERVQALAGGFIDASIIDYPSGIQFVEDGRFKFLASATEERLEVTPEIPTIKELGYDIIWSVKRGIVLPKGTSEDIREILENAFSKVAADPEYITEIEKVNSSVNFMGSESYQAYLDKLDKDIAKAAEKIK